MKRTAEFVCGLVGSILATAFQGLMLLGTSVIASNPDIYAEMGIYFNTDQVNEMYTMYAIAFVASLVAIVFSCLVNKKTKLSGIMLIILAVALEFINMLNIISFVLLMISGVMCLARKPKKEQITIQETVINIPEDSM